MKQQPGDELELLTPDDVARLLHVKKRQLDRFGIPAIKLGHKTIRYSRAQLLAFLEKQRA